MQEAQVGGGLSSPITLPSQGSPSESTGSELVEAGPHSPPSKVTHVFQWVECFEKFYHNVVEISGWQDRERHISPASQY